MSLLNNQLKHQKKSVIKREEGKDLLPLKPKEKWKYIKKLKNL